MQDAFPKKAFELCTRRFFINSHKQVLISLDSNHFLRALITLNSNHHIPLNSNYNWFSLHQLTQAGALFPAGFNLPKQQP